MPANDRQPTATTNVTVHHGDSPLPFAGRRCMQIVAVLFATLAANLAIASAPGLGDRFIVLNLQRAEIRRETFAEIAAIAKSRSPRAPRIGVGVIVSYFAAPRDQNVKQLRESLRLADEFDRPIVVQLDGEQWWLARPDLWNWWDPNRSGFDPANVANVEWSGWGPENALTIAWRNWGSQIRTLPPPNLMSRRYRAACHEEMAPLLNEIVDWRVSLGDRKAHLLIGVKIGWESSFGVNSYYYPDGNSLTDADPADDPVQLGRVEVIPSRGFQPIGYAAVSTAKLARSGDLQDRHLTEVVRLHLADLAAAVRQAGLPRDQVFAHCGGWANGESLYRAALNEHSCPGWSFYTLAADPSRDRTAMAAAAGSDAPFWAAAKWYAHSARTADDWTAAIQATLRIDRCRYVGIYNWHDVAKDASALEGIRKLMRNSPE